MSCIEKIDNKKINYILVISAFVFNLLIFAPLEIYYTNKSELWFNVKEFLPVILIVSLLTFLFLLLIIEKLNKKRNVFINILFSLLLGLYIQGNFLNFGYGVLDGTEINWNSMIGKAIINTIVWIIILLIPFAFKKLKKEKKFTIVSSVISAGIIAIEIITLIVLIITQKTNRDNLGLENKNIFNLSKKENIIVFMADTFEAKYMNKILEENPEYKDKLEDFTYFDNCTGVSTFTYSSLPTLFTGEECQVGKTLEENLEYCFGNTKLYDVLEKNNYSAEIYTEKALMPNDYKIKNLSSDINLSHDLITNSKVALNMYKYTLYRYMPHVLKPNFYLTNNDFNQIKAEDKFVDYKSDTYYLEDVEFNKELIYEGITSNNKKNSFKFYHMNGIHGPFNTTEEIEYNNTVTYSKLPEETRMCNEAKASVNILCNYVNELKKAGIYDQTTIIFLADHGYANRFHVTLLVKKANDSHEFNVSSAPVSLKEDLIPTILNTATKSKDYGKDFFDYKENEIRARQTTDYVYESYVYTGDRHKVFSKITYQTDSHAQDSKAYYIVDEQYVDEDKELTQKYNFGNKINLQQISNLQEIKLIGFNTEKTVFHLDFGTNYTKNASVVINRKQTNTDVVAKFYIDQIYGTTQTINFKIAGEQIYSQKLDNNSIPKEISFIIPKDIWNKNENITIDMEFPNAGEESDVNVVNSAIKLKTIEFTN